MYMYVHMYMEDSCLFSLFPPLLSKLPLPYPPSPHTSPPPHISFPSHSLPSPGTLCDFEDECGDMYFAENDGLAYRHLTRRLFLRYTEDVSMSVSCIVY